MFTIGETVFIPALQQDIEVTSVGKDLLRGISKVSGLEVALALSSHAYKDLLLAEPTNPAIIHSAHIKDAERKIFIHPTGAVYSAKWYGKQFQWAINGKQASASKVWADLYL